MSTGLAESVTGTTGDLFGETPPDPDPVPDPDPEDEPVALAPVVDIDLGPDLDLDDSTVAASIDDLDDDEVRARLVKAERRAEYERSQRITSSRRLWETEATQHFPYSNPAEIKAESRTQFLTEAKRQDTAFRANAAPLLEKLRTQMDARVAKEVARIQAEKDAGWGTPTVGSGVTAPPGQIAQATAKEKLDRARSRRDMDGAVAALMEGGAI